MEYAIEVKNLKKSFQSLAVIKDCSLSVRLNEIYGFLGAKHRKKQLF
jgi:ABC-type multidrug transport system ATPase subunit